MERARWGVWDQAAALVPMNYIDHVQRAGGTALLIPPDPALVERPERVLDRLDGLLLVGGVDVDAALYGAVRHERAEQPVPLRDSVELALVRAAIARGLPLLGICRGMQAINVALGGSLRQHLPDDLGNEEHRRAIGRFDGNEHEVSLEPGSRAAEAAGELRHQGVSHHHQGVARLGAGLRISGRADDGVIEAVEGSDAGWLLGVQWHPEADPDSAVIGALVRAAADRGRPAHGNGPAPPPPATGVDRGQGGSPGPRRHRG